MEHYLKKGGSKLGFNRFMFIDESGSLGGDTKYFVVSGVVFKESPIELNQLARELLEKLISRNRRYKDSLGKTNEIKASELTIQDKEFAVSYLMENADFEVIAVYISKDAKFVDWLARNINKRKTIVFLDRRLISTALAFNPAISEIFIDKSHYIKGVEKNVINLFDRTKISFEDSWKHGGLQFADLVANAFFIKLEPSKRIMGPYELLKENILSEELIYWKSIKKFKL